MKNQKLPEVLGQLKQKVLSLKFFKIIFIILGIASHYGSLSGGTQTTRAGYPCMRAAAPIMSGFVLYLLSLGGITMLFRKAVANVKKARYLSAAFALSACLALLVVFNWQSAQKIYSQTVGFTRGVLPDGANNPMGEGIGKSRPCCLGKP
jgi:hypothetical protein